MLAVDSTKWNRAKRLLCVRLDSIGDVLMTTPAIRALKEGGADREITLLTSASGASVAKLIPQIDEVLIYDAPWLKASDRRRASEIDLAMAATLKSMSFDGSVIFTVYSQSALPSAVLCYLADVPLRLAHCRENPYQLLTHWIPDPEPQNCIRHEVRRQLDLVASIGCRPSNEHLSINISVEAKRRALEILHYHGVNLRNHWLIMHPGATAPSRRYPVEGFAEVARRLHRDNGYQIILTGSEEDKPILEGIRETCGVPTVTFGGMTNIEQVAALIAICPGLITNNSAPAHIAAATNTPVVDLYALTNPQHTPWLVRHHVLSHDVPCKYCYKSVCPENHHNCLRLIEPAQVITAALDLFDSAFANRFR